jgi:hypothetical protein
MTRTIRFDRAGDYFDLEVEGQRNEDCWEIESITLDGVPFPVTDAEHAWIEHLFNQLAYYSADTDDWDDPDEVFDEPLNVYDPHCP